MEHIQEIRSLRQRLEDSIKTNEKLRRQLERRGSEFDQGKEDLPKGASLVMRLPGLTFCVLGRASNLRPERLQFKSGLCCLSPG